MRILLIAVVALCLGAWGAAPAPECSAQETGGAAAPPAAAREPAAPERPFYFLGPHLFPYNYGIAGLIVGDMNGDRRPDLCFLDNRLSKIQFLLQRAEGEKAEAAGQGAASLPADVNKIVPDAFMKKGGFLTNQEVTAYTLLELGGRLGMAYFCNTKELFVARRQEDGEWKNEQRLLPELDSTFCGGFEAADLNGDGLSDLVFLAEDAVLIFRQQEGGTLGGPARYSLAQPRCGGLKMGDIDGDGRADLLFIAPGTLYPLHIRLTQPDGAPGPEYRFRMPEPRDATIADVDGDERNEIVLIESTTNRIKVYCWHLREAATGDTLEFGSVQLVPLAHDSKAELRDFAVGDVDGNGLPDILVADPGSARMTLIRCERGKGMLPPESFPSFQETCGVLMVPAGQPPRMAAFILSRKEALLGVSRYDAETGRMTYPEPVDLEGSPQCVALRPAGEHGPDGVICLLSVPVAGEKKQKRSELAVIELGEKGWRVVSKQEAPGLDTPPERLVSLDVNGDGRVDLLALRTYELALLLLQNAEGKFENVSAAPEFRKHLLGKLTPSAIVSAPLQNGGPLLLVLCQENMARMMAYEDGNLVIKDQFSSRRANAAFQAVGVSDLDDDGTAEILLLDAKAELLSILKRDDNGVFDVARQIEVGPFSAIGLQLLDLDGDGSFEIVIAGRDKLGVISRSGLAPELLEVASIETDEEGACYAQVAVGDLNEDGRNELVLRETGKAQVEVFARNEQEGWASRMRFKVFESRPFSMGMPGAALRLQEPRELVIGDLTGDGLNDMAIILHDRVIVYPQQQ